MMNMDNTRLQLLIRRAICGTISTTEHNELQERLADAPDDNAVIHVLRQHWETLETDNEFFSREEGQEILQRILEKNDDTHVRRSKGLRKPYGYWLAIAASMLFVAISWQKFDCFFGFGQSKSVPLQQAIAESGIVPGRDRATLVSANGNILNLDGTDTGITLKDGLIYAHRPDSEADILYPEIQSDTLENSGYYTLSVPKGGHYRVVLDDGTKIHLNAASTLRFPVRFTGNTREVELTGEGLFEVTSNKDRPFMVKTPQQTIRVLGTTFNIQAYPDIGETKTTLVEGVVEVLRQDRVTMLQPGETAVSRPGEKDVEIKKGSVNKDIAWHNDYFIFENENIVSIMDRVARWYDVDVSYEGRLDHIHLGGIFQRSKSIVRLLESFEATGLITFSLEGRRIIVKENRNDA